MADGDLIEATIEPYLRAPAYRQAVNIPGSPFRWPSLFITKYGRVCKINKHMNELMNERKKQTKRKSERMNEPLNERTDNRIIEVE